MENANKLRDKMRRGEVCLGPSITLSDPSVTEALCSVFDFMWIDMEHSALTIERVGLHILATNGTDTAPLVRVPWNDPVLIKPVLDIGAAGIIAPMVRTAEEARRTVAACRYPPEGIRGFGPRRPAKYGRLGGPAFCQAANETIFVVAQIEHREAVQNLDEILTVPGLSAIVIGPNDLAASMGHIGEPRHPEVLPVIGTILGKARAAGVFTGIAGIAAPEHAIEWVDRGAQWIQYGSDVSLMLGAADQRADVVRAHVRKRRPSE